MGNVTTLEEICGLVVCMGPPLRTGSFAA